MTHVAIVGPGAVGGMVAARLIQTGMHEVMLCARQPLAELRLETASEEIRVQPVVFTDPAAAPAVDWALVTTKAYDVAGTVRWLERLCSGGGKAAILQNGVEHRERFDRVLPPDRIVPVIVDTPVERVAPGHVRQRGPGLMTVADDAPGRAFAALFAGTGIDVVLSEDLKTAAWRKLCLNAAGVLSGVVLKPAGVMHDESIAEAARAIVRECVAVARAEGAALDDTMADIVVASCRKAPRDAVNSLHADRMAGRRTEIDARNGVIVRLGRKHGIATPCNQLAVALIEAMSP